ncbi:MAG TPA: SagB/ThcOx family dehydrogenase [Vicinamibacterales bacterium]|nr:SagB/ThcOx family dehydrogenase [Vicinamibacterales bacterium]
MVVYWRNGTLRARNYLTRLETPVTAAVLDVLEQLTDWTTASEVARRIPSLGPPRDVGRLLERLVQRRLVCRDADADAEPPLGEWTVWHPEAAFFHFATKNGRYRPDPFSYDAELAAKARTVPTPAPTKTIDGRALPLPPGRALGDLGRTLTARRTWRRFGKRMLALDELATLLGWTFGVQKRVGVPGQGDIVLKTSPSGGARHPIEAYVVALSVRGLAAGSVHHYDAEGHRLVRLPGRVPRSRIAAELGHQPYFASAAALVLMAPVFARTMWRYPSSRVYRSVLIEAGHLCQTFCLVATALRLAPFSTIGFGELAWERALGLDGISEAPIYIAGVGARPGDTQRAGTLPARWARKVKPS